MDLNLLATFVERLRAKSIGDPEWVELKNVFEYSKQNLEAIVVLKLVRAAQGVYAMNLLCRNGFFFDMAVIYRCVGDCVSEVYFLLETYPKKSNHVEKFINEFFSKTIDGHLSSEKESVRTNKVHNAMIRALTSREQDERIKNALTNVYKTFSGYVHAGYAHIMQMFGGSQDKLSFNIAGVPSKKQKDIQITLVLSAYESVLHTIAHASHTFNIPDLRRDVMQYLEVCDTKTTF